MMDKYEKRRLALKALIGRLGRGGITQIADRTGIDDSSISRMQYPTSKPGFKRIGEDSADKISEAYPGWLDNLLPSSDSAKPVALAYSSSNDNIILIRQFDTGGGMGGGVVLRDQPGAIKAWSVEPEWLNKNVKHHTGAKNLVIVTGFGDSMRPMFNPGDPLLVDVGIRSVDFDAIYFFRVGDEGFIKRLQRIPGEGLRAISSNKEYESWTIRPGMDFEVFGRVLKVWCSEEF